MERQREIVREWDVCRVGVAFCNCLRKCSMSTCKSHVLLFFDWAHHCPIRMHHCRHIVAHRGIYGQCWGGIILDVFSFLDFVCGGIQRHFLIHQLCLNPNRVQLATPIVLQVWSPLMSNKHQSRHVVIFVVHFVLRLRFQHCCPPFVFYLFVRKSDSHRRSVTNVCVCVRWFHFFVWYFEPPFRPPMFVLPVVVLFSRVCFMRFVCCAGFTACEHVKVWHLMVVFSSSCFHVCFVAFLVL